MLDTLCHILAGPPDLAPWSTVTPADWEHLVRTAQAHGVAPLLCHTLTQAGALDQVPAGLRLDLQRSYYKTAAHNAIIFRELARFLDAMPRSSSSIIILKGAALAATLYASAALRPVSDLDLLVSRRHIAQAVQVFHNMGYDEFRPKAARNLDQAVIHHAPLRGGPRQSVVVELHHNLVAGDADWRTPPLDWFWEQTEEWKMEGGKWRMERGKGKMEVGKGKEESNFHPPFSILHSPSSNLHSPFSILQLTPTAHLLYLAAHLALQHGSAVARLIWFYDIHLLITRWGDRIDWDELGAQAEEFHWTAALCAALRGTQARFDTPVQPGFLDRLLENQDTRTVRLVERKADPRQTRVMLNWNSLSTLDWPARFHRLRGLVCPAPAYVRWRYQPRPAWLWPLYYPYRWFDILRDGLATLRRIVSDR